MKQQFNVTGMSCAACSAHVEKAVSALDGAEQVQVNLLAGTMTVVYDADRLGTEAILKAVTDAGYGASLRGQDTAQAAAQPDDGAALRAMQRRIIVSFFFLALLMYVSMGHMIGLPQPGFLTGP